MYTPMHLDSLLILSLTYIWRKARNVPEENINIRKTNLIEQDLKQPNTTMMKYYACAILFL